MSSNKIIGVRNGATEIVDSVTEGFVLGPHRRGGAGKLIKRIL